MFFSKVFLFFYFFISFTLLGQTTINGGVVSGVWTKAGSPYKVHGDIIVKNGTKLIVEAGVNIIFQQYKTIYVYGAMQCFGEKSDKILFSSVDSTTGWQGIFFKDNKAGVDSNILNYCILEYGRHFDARKFRVDRINKSHGAMIIDSAIRTRISNCIIRKNASFYGAGISIKYGVAFIYNTDFINNLAIADDILDSMRALAPCLSSSGSVLTILNCKFIGNNAYTRNVTNPWSFNSSGGIVISNSDVYADHLLFENNKCVDGGATINVGMSTYGEKKRKAIFKNIIARNNYTDKGYIIYTSFDEYTKSDSIIFDSMQLYNNISPGGAFNYYDNGDTSNRHLEIKNSKIYNHKGRCALSLNDGQCLVRNTMIYNCDSIGVSLINPIGTIFYNCIIVNNGCGLSCTNAIGSSIYNSIIANNGTMNKNLPVAGGLDLFGFSLQNNIIQNNYNRGRLANLTQCNKNIIYEFVRGNIIQGSLDTPSICKDYTTKSNFSILYKFINYNDTVAFENPIPGIGPNYNITNFSYKPLNTCISEFKGLDKGFTNIFNYDGNYFEFQKDLEGKNRIKCKTIDIGPYEFDGLKVNFPTPYINPIMDVCKNETVRVNNEICADQVTFEWYKSKDGNSWTSLKKQNIMPTYLTIIDTSYYKVEAYQAECKVVKTSNIIKVEPLPLVNPNLGKDTIVLENEQLILDAGSNFKSYLWNTGRTSRYLKVDKSNLQPGINKFWVNTEYISGCFSTDTIYIVYKLLGGISTIHSKLYVYPNPAKYTLNIVGNGNYHFEIRDMTGKKIIGLTQLKSTNKIDIQQLNSGAFILVLYEGKMKYIVKFIKLE